MFAAKDENSVTNDLFLVLTLHISPVPDWGTVILTDDYAALTV